MPRSGVLPALFLASCFGSGDGAVAMKSTDCGIEGTCGGAADCYSICFCERGSTQVCERECGPRGDRVQDLDEDAWSAEWEALETEVLNRTNAARTEGACCGEKGCFSSMPPVTLNMTLRRSARAHAGDMGERGYTSHDSPDGRTAFDRIRESGFRGCAIGENIAVGQATPTEVVESWLASPEHCANIMTEDFDALGVGYYFAPSHIEMHIWVQNFGG